MKKNAGFSQIDPRWKAGEVIGNVEDGITVEFVEFSADGKLLVAGEDAHVRLYRIISKMGN